MEGLNRVMPPVPESVKRQAEKLRVAGNTYYKMGRYGAAIDAYTEAIVLHPDVPLCWTNRAFCFRRKKEWVRVEEDCRKAIVLDPQSVKGHFLLGLALLERNDYAGSVKMLERTFDLGREAIPDSYIMEEVWLALSKAKYMIWVQESVARSGKMKKLREACEKALTEHFLCELDPSQADGISEQAVKAHMEQLEYLREVFDKAEKADKQEEVPDFLCCKLTLEIYRDPVIAPSGITYEKAMILDHLRKVGQFDPITREPLEQNQLVPNVAIREAVRAFLVEHGWAYKIPEISTVVLE